MFGQIDNWRMLTHLLGTWNATKETLHANSRRDYRNQQLLISEMSWGLRQRQFKKNKQANKTSGGRLYNTLFLLSITVTKNFFNVDMTCLQNTAVRAYLLYCLTTRKQLEYCAADLLLSTDDTPVPSMWFCPPPDRRISAKCSYK